MTSHPGAGLQELEDLKSSGTEVMVRMPAEVDLMQLMEPAAVPKALALGARQAQEDAASLAAFWDEPDRGYTARGARCRVGSGPAPPVALGDAGRG